MSTLAPAQVIPRLEHTGRVTQLRVFLSELTKLRSVRSTKWSLFAAFVLTIGVPAIAAAVVSHHWPHGEPARPGRLPPARGQPSSASRSPSSRSACSACS